MTPRRCIPCDVCRKPITDLGVGLLQWITAGDLRIVHKGRCDERVESDDDYCMELGAAAGDEGVDRLLCVMTDHGVTSASVARVMRLLFLEPARGSAFRRYSPALTARVHALTSTATAKGAHHRV